MNPAGLSMIDMSLAEVRGTNYMNFAHPDEIPVLKMHWDAAITKGVTTRFTFKGSIEGKLYSSCFSPIVVDGVITRIVGFTLDISDDNNIKFT